MALQVTSDISFRLNPGDRVALIGPNGAGKTTLVNLITGDLAPTAGRFLMEGCDITGESIAARVRLGLVRTFQTHAAICQPHRRRQCRAGDHATPGHHTAVFLRRHRTTRGSRRVA